MPDGQSASGEIAPWIYREGWDAFMRGDGITTSPYLTRASREAWLEGWRDAERERQKDERSLFGRSVSRG